MGFGVSICCMCECGSSDLFWFMMNHWWLGCFVGEIE